VTASRPPSPSLALTQGIWAGFVSETGTNPAQMPKWNRSRGELRAVGKPGGWSAGHVAHHVAQDVRGRGEVQPRVADTQLAELGALVQLNTASSEGT